MWWSIRAVRAAVRQRSSDISAGADVSRMMASAPSYAESGTASGVGYKAVAPGRVAGYIYLFFRKVLTYQLRKTDLTADSIAVGLGVAVNDYSCVLFDLMYDLRKHAVYRPFAICFTYIL